LRTSGRLLNRAFSGWQGETAGADSEKLGTFTYENIEKIVKILNKPIYNGWISIDYYLIGNFYRLKVYFDNDISKSPFNYVGVEFGCLSLLLFPIFTVINFLFIGESQEIKKK
jgi:hypothetical protein